MPVPKSKYMNAEELDGEADKMHSAAEAWFKNDTDFLMQVIIIYA